MTTTVEKSEVASIDESYDEIINLKQSEALKQSDKSRNRDDYFYFYSAGNFHFILEKGFKPETLENTELTNVPFLPDWYAGILSIHGLIIPVIDIIKFTASQGIDQKGDSSKQYLLKLEHAEYQPLVLKIDSLPKTINIGELQTIEAGENSPSWIKKYLRNDSVDLAFVDHKDLFEQFSTKQ